MAVHRVTALADPAAPARVKPSIDLENIFAKSRLPLYPYGGILVVA